METYAAQELAYDGRFITCLLSGAVVEASADGSPGLCHTCLLCSCYVGMSG